MSTGVLAESRLSLSSPLIAAGDSPAADAATVAAWDHAATELRRFGELKADWDGQGAQAPDLALVKHALRWVTEMQSWGRALPPTHVAPGASGELVLEWRGEAYYLAAELASLEHVDWLLRIPNRPIKQWQTDAHTLWIVQAQR